MNLSTNLPLLALATLALAGAAAAQPPGPGPGRGPGGPFGLLAMDTNGDGKLTRAEFDAGQRAHFAEIDTNKDGTATPEEFRKFHETKRAEMSKIRFDAIDKDKNGQLSQAELAAAKEDKAGPDGPRGHHGRGRDHDVHGKRGGDDDAKPLSFTEFSARGLEGFTRADANKDGTVTITELQGLKTSKL